MAHRPAVVPCCRILPRAAQRCGVYVVLSVHSATQCGRLVSSHVTTLHDTVARHKTGRDDHTTPHHCVETRRDNIVHETMQHITTPHVGAHNCVRQDNVWYGVMSSCAQRSHTTTESHAIAHGETRHHITLHSITHDMRRDEMRQEETIWHTTQRCHLVCMMWCVLSSCRVSRCGAVWRGTVSHVMSRLMPYAKWCGAGGGVSHHISYRLMSPYCTAPA